MVATWFETAALTLGVCSVLYVLVEAWLRRRYHRERRTMLAGLAVNPNEWISFEGKFVLFVLHKLAEEDLVERRGGPGKRVFLARITELGRAVAAERET